jgi:hypothetical protein
MALTQKQLFLASQLYVMSGKSSLGFDLSRFVSDQTHRLETLGHLAAAAAEPALQELVAQAIVAFMPEDVSEPAQAPIAQVSAKAHATRTPEYVDTRYIGRLR